MQNTTIEFHERRNNGGAATAAHFFVCIIPRAATAGAVLHWATDRIAAAAAKQTATINELLSATADAVLHWVKLMYRNCAAVAALLFPNL